MAVNAFREGATDPSNGMVTKTTDHDTFNFQPQFTTEPTAPQAAIPGWDWEVRAWDWEAGRPDTLTSDYDLLAVDPTNPNVDPSDPSVGLFPTETIFPTEMIRPTDDGLLLPY